jgi:hypothetical protein
MMPYKPNSTDPWVEVILNRLDAEFEPIEINVTKVDGSIVNDCFNIVQEKVINDGGKMVIGWQIWKSPFLIEAECHAVWEDEMEKLWDITPKVNNAKNILFLEDDSILYENKQINSVRLNITENELVDQFIETFNAKFRFLNKGDWAQMYDLTDVMSDFEKEMLNALYIAQNGIAQILNKGGNLNSKCFCNSNKKYINCHGANFIKMMKNY